MGRRRIVMMMVSEWEGGGGRERGREGLKMKCCVICFSNQICTLVCIYSDFCINVYKHTNTELPDLESDEVEVDAMSKEGKE